MALYPSGSGNYSNSSGGNVFTANYQLTTQAFASADSAAILLLPERATRKGVILVNRTINELFLGYDNTVDSNKFTLSIPPSNTITLPIPYTGEIWAYSIGMGDGYINITEYFS